MLNVPIYLHPTEVSSVIRTYYYEGNWNSRCANVFSGFGIGWHYDTAMHVMRLILSGVFDKLPDLKVIIGHWGEMLPYYFNRMNDALNQNVTGLRHEIQYYFLKNIYTNPSGMFYKDNFEFCLSHFDPSHILWAQDYPYGTNDKAVYDFLNNMDLDDELKKDIAYRNAEQLFHIKL